MFGNQLPQAEMVVSEWNSAATDAQENNKNGNGERDNDDRDWNRSVLKKVGVRLGEGIKALHQKDHEKVLENLIPIR